MKTVVGVSAFGLNDCAAQLGAGCHELGFYPTSAVLPTSPFGRILTGDEAYRERTHLGLPWPPEARIQPNETLQRSPIAAVWRALVEAGDRTVRWNTGPGVFFPLARILASHIKGLITKDRSGEGHFPSSGPGKQPAVLAVAIPDHLDEFGQELLLRELTALECSELKPFLVWRPVAAALSWLDKVEGDLPKRMGENDHIHIICLSPDALEFTTLRLRVREHGNQYYVLPLRDRPKNLPPLTGMDWAGRLLEVFFKGIDQAAFWQAFIQFPEIWQTLAGRTWNLQDLPRPWSKGQEWTLWNPSPDIAHCVYQVEARLCKSLRQIIEKSLELNDDKGALSGSFGEVFRREVRRMGQIFPGGRLRGMIVCGPLAPSMIPPWLDSELQFLTTRGLRSDGNLALPEAGRLWLCADCDDPVSQGAAIYAQRRMENIPTYLDTMPQLSILAQDRGRYTWIPLLEAQEVQGGDEHRDRIERRFQLEAGKRNLHVYLHKGPVDDALTEILDPFDPQSIPTDGISPCRARLVREIVRRLGSLKAVQSCDHFRSSNQEARYGHAFAEAIFASKGADDSAPPELSKEELIRTPLRRAVFDFPSAPERDTVLDIEVRIRPASGLARIEILPEDASFLQGERVLLNYSNMRFASRLPRRMRGWPRTEEIVVHPEDVVLLSREFWVNSFERTQPTARDYIRVLDAVRNNVFRGNTRIEIAGLQFYVGAIDQNGRACTEPGNAIVRRIAQKLEDDFQQLQSARQTQDVRDITTKVISRAGWLYTCTPPIILAHVRKILMSESAAGVWRSAVEAAGRAFSDVEDFRLLFESVARRCQRQAPANNRFTEYAGRSICRILMYREDGQRGLDRTNAQLFAGLALERLLQEQTTNNVSRVYFQMVQLLLYLLRYRITDPSCFDPTSSHSISAFKKAQESMADAKNSLPRHSPRAGQIQRIIEGFDQYLHYEGTEDVISVLRDLAEEDGD